MVPWVKLAQRNGLLRIVQPVQEQIGQLEHRLRMLERLFLLYVRDEMPAGSQ